MAFGWFSKKSDTEKALERARKFGAQGRWAEALSFYEDARAAGDSEEISAEMCACRSRLVASNLEEARGCSLAGDADRAREHAALALEFAAGEPELAAEAQAALEELGRPSPAPPPRPPERLFEPTCSCPAPQHEPSEPAEEPEELGHPADLFEFYLESLSEPERRAFEPLEGAFRDGFVLLQQGRVREARPLLEEAEVLEPDALGIQYALGLLAAVEGNPEEAASRFRRTLEEAPGFAPAAHHRAQVLREAGRAREAVESLETWLRDNEEDGEAWVLLGGCRLEAGEMETALAAAEAGERHTAEGDPSPLLLRARILRLQGDSDGALEALRKVAARRPDLLEALVPLGQILIEKGGASAERAAEVFKHCYRLDPERGWWHLLRVSQAYAVRGWNAEARQMLEAAGQELPDTSEARADWEAAAQAFTR